MRRPDESVVGVALVKEACQLCGQLVDGPIIINTRLTKAAADEVNQMHGECVGYLEKPCDECQKLMNLGIVIVEVDEEKSKDENNPYRTGRVFVVKEGALDGMFNSEAEAAINKRRAVFMTQESVKEIGIDKIKPTLTEEDL